MTRKTNRPVQSQLAILTRGCKAYSRAKILTDVLRRDDQIRDRVCQTEDEVRSSEPSNVDHGPSKSWLDDTITHANDKQEEERERVSSCVEDAH
jgi:hypothetical protein